MAETRISIARALSKWAGLMTFLQRRHQGIVAEGVNHRPDVAQAAAISLLCDACALLTSAVKAEREDGKQRVRAWRAAGVSHAKPSEVE